MSADPADVVVTLDGAAHSGATPLICAVDPILTRGAAVFETTLVRGGRPCLLDAHLARLERSAVTVGLPRPDTARWRAAVDTAVASWHSGGDAVLRLVSGRMTSFVMISGVPPRAITARCDGVAAVTLEPGPRTALTGVKSLSYALNSAALREAARRGADDVIFVSVTGEVLEGPRSSVVIASDGMLLSPPATRPILAGTTVGALFDIGPSCAFRPLQLSDLFAAQGVWLLSAVTLAARVHTLDGMPLAAAPMADEVATLVDEAILR